ncbi:N-acetylmuramoyl-L-alanine amidase family protein [Ferrovibrio xuzhouensis]|uniref:N-acetylmuramoyl-L-alanine amidase n=1 Tax=Ferrovibrio xuzhouensis TaxID=1576914 RepID=A0ABV7VLE6_9PROT
MVRCHGADPQGLSRHRARGFGPAGGFPINKLFLFVFSLFFLSGAASAAALRVTGLQLGLNAGLTRLVVEADGPLNGSLSAAADGLGLVLTLSQARWDAAVPSSRAAGLVAGLGLPVDSAGQVSLGIDLVEPAVVERAFRLPPQGTVGDRLVIDLRPADPQAWQAAFAAPVSLPLAGSADILPPPPVSPGRLRLVVLDPGHGGQDPGAISAAGRYEKDVTLAIARAVATRLRQTHRYRVLMTREADRFIRLGDRVALARRHEADLFLSIHADSLAADRATRGASVYVRADDASDTDAEALALRENRADQLAEGAPARDVNEVVAILLDLASRDTGRLSSRFAGLLTASLGHRLTLRHNALRAANFKVLSAPDIPSALLELGYLSNPADEALLFSDAGRAELAEGVVAAIDRFFGVDDR